MTTKTKATLIGGLVALALLLEMAWGVLNHRFTPSPAPRETAQVKPPTPEGQAEDPPAGSKRYPARQLSSPVQFSVVVVVDKGGGPRFVGKISPDKPLEIPACDEWWVFIDPPPGTSVSIEKVAAEVESQQIPGLHLPGRTGDADVAHLAHLTALRELSVSASGVTDAGLEHLRGMQGLRILDLQQNKITDAGLEALTGLTRLRQQLLDRGIDESWILS